MSKGVISMGIKCPIIREGDDLVKIVVDSVLSTVETKVQIPVPNKNHLVDFKEKIIYDLNDKDVIGITESVVARSAGLYITVDDIANDIKSRYGEWPTIILSNPIYSRNRFAMILKGIARACSKVIIDMPEYDEVGNPSGINPFTGVNIKEYYKSICESEECEFELYDASTDTHKVTGVIYCGLRDFSRRDTRSLIRYNLADICSDRNPDFGVLGSNKATEEKLKLFPTRELAKVICEGVQQEILNRTGKKVEVMVYGDGCFKSPYTNGVSIWEFADPVTSPGYTKGLEGSPSEIKLKALADDKLDQLSGSELTEAVKKEIRGKESDLIGNMKSQGTTPRRYVDLLASLMDLTSGSGDKGTPVVLIKNYFKSYADE